MSDIRPVILSGGSGTRLWPLSTPDLPKQFADLAPGLPILFDATLGRLDGVAGVGAPVVVTGIRHLELVSRSLERVGIGESLVLVEPQGRNTGPAVAAAALSLDPDEVMVILPSDHVIDDLARFRGAVSTASDLARQDSIVTFGVVPTRPDTGYGYIEVGESIGGGGAFRVTRFKEKPDEEEAERLVSDGRHLWNSGMFVARAGTVVSEMDRLQPRLLTAVRDALPGAPSGVVELGERFTAADSMSFDHAVMEHTDHAVVVPLDAGWDDVGSYLALHAHSVLDGDGNAVSGRVVLDDVTGSLILSHSRVVAVAGVSGIAVIETPDAVLVVPLDQSQRVRKLAEGADSA